MSQHDTLCFVDVGGTKVDFCVVTANHESSDISFDSLCRDTAKTPLTSPDLVHLIAHYAKESGAQKVIIGLPGAVPTHPSPDYEVYLPPCGFSITSRSFEQEISNVKLMNDMQVLSGLLRGRLNESIVLPIDFRVSNEPYLSSMRKGLLTFGTSVGFILSVFSDSSTNRVEIPLELAHRRQPSRFTLGEAETLMEIFDGRKVIRTSHDEQFFIREAAVLVENLTKEYSLDEIYIGGGRRCFFEKHLDYFSSVVGKILVGRREIANRSVVFILKSGADLFAESAKRLAADFL